MRRLKDTHARSLCIGLGRSRYGGCRNPGNDKLPVSHRAGKSQIWLQTDRHRPAPASQSYPQHIDNIEMIEAFWADKQGIYRASYLLVWKDYPKTNTVSQAVSQHGKDSYIRDVLNLYAK